MALFQPTNVIPSSLSGGGNGTVDVTKALTISWQVNGTSPLVAYRIKIMKNDEESTLLLTIGKTTLNTPFYGADALGNPIRFEVEVSSSAMTGAGMTNGYANGYKMTIEQWWSSTESILQTSASYFITRKDPTLTLRTIPYQYSFRQQLHTFEAYYGQAQGDTLEWNRWELQAKENGEWVTVDDTGYIFGAGLIHDTHYDIIQYTYNGFCIGATEIEDTPGLYDNGIPYRVRCTIQTESGVQASTGWQEFITQNMGEDLLPGIGMLNLCVMREKDAVRVSMPKNFPLLGTATGTYSYIATPPTGHRIQLSSGAEVTWGGSDENSLKINESPYKIWAKCVITDVSPMVYLTCSYGTRTINFGYDATGFYISIGNTVLWRADIAPVLNATFGIGLMHDRVFFLQKNGATVQTDNTEIDAWETGEMQSVTIYGPITFDFVEILEEDPARASWLFFYNSMTSDYYAPVLLVYTLFVASFNYTLYTGDYFIGDHTPDSEEHHGTDCLGIYRKAKSDYIFQWVATLPLNTSTKDTVIHDYSARTGMEYEYYLLYMVHNLYGIYAKGRTGIAGITPCWWNYTVLCCNEDEQGSYIVQTEYRFSLNIASGSVGNNNNPTLQQNFTRYPLRQPVSSNYRSGTLSAFIGKVENGQYVGTKDLMDELYALSTDTRVKFLKTRKGQLFRIETMSPVSMQITDKYAQQPAQMKLPWVEVGDAENANILYTES